MAHAFRDSDKLVEFLISLEHLPIPPYSLHLIGYADNNNNKINSAFCPWLKLWHGVFTSVGWQVRLCDPIWQVALL